MSKRILVALMALSVVSVYACGDDNDGKKGDSGGGCVLKDQRCNGAVAEVCGPGGWIDMKLNCAASNQECKLDVNPADSKLHVASCAAGGSTGCEDFDMRCNGTLVEICAANQWHLISEANPALEADCAKSGATCELSTSPENASLHVAECKGGSVNVNVCDPACDSDTQICSKGTCVDKADLVTEGGEIGDPCDVNEYEQSCKDSGAHALVCDSKTNSVTQWNCAKNECEEDTANIGKVICPKGLPEDIPETCVRGTDKGICSTVDNKPYICGDTGYYQGKCTGTCFECPDGFWVACGATKEEACKDHMDAPQSCGADFESYCSEDLTKGYFCSNGLVKSKNCTDPAWKCSNVNGYIDCVLILELHSFIFYHLYWYART